VSWQLDESKKQVTYLRRLLKRKVASLQLIADQHRESKAAADTLVAQKESVELALEEQASSALSREENLLDDLVREKAAITSLKMQPVTAYVA
jgi:hypothetical protein